MGSDIMASQARISAAVATARAFNRAAVTLKAKGYEFAHERSQRDNALGRARALKGTLGSKARRMVAKSKAANDAAQKKTRQRRAANRKASLTKSRSGSKSGTGDS